MSRSTSPGCSTTCSCSRPSTWTVMESPPLLACIPTGTWKPYCGR
uniref:Uncharacterized protein n=1 Tax=Anguilla anguilla TaxID=7936 RepID=A0A0E9V0S9_ANGAN